MTSLTAANVKITLSITGLFPVPQQLQGFATDDVYDVGQLDNTETMFGVDGKLSAGFVFNPVDQTFSLMADSESNTIFEQWAAQQRRAKDVFRAQGLTTLPAVNRSYVSSNGVLVNISPMPTAKRILQPRRYMIRWESVVAVPN